MTCRAPAALAAAATLLSVALSGCGGAGDGGSATTLTVLAASSLTDAFGNAGAAYEKERPGTDIRFSFAGSQSLAAQIRQGSPADLLVTAAPETMADVRGETRKPVVLATNRLTLVTAPGNPHRIGSLRDLADRDLKVVLAAEEVPVGGYSREILDRQGVTVRPVSLESNVRAVLSKVELGEADAGIVYETDAHTSGDRVGTVRLPAGRNAVASYPAAVLDDARHAEEAAGFLTWLRGEEGFAHLREEGFRRP